MHISSTPTRRKSPPRKKARKLARHPLRETLIRMITSGEFRPGEKLAQTRLARRFRVSMGVMREALLDLQVYGLVETHDNRGFFVRRFDGETILELYDLREMLEGLVARKACGRITPAQLQELRQVIDSMCEAETAGEHARRAELDRHFHDRLCQISGSATLLSLVRQCSLFGKSIYTETSVEHIREMHDGLLNAIAANQPADAELRAREHVRDGRGTVVDHIQNGGHGLYWLGAPET